MVRGKEQAGDEAIDCNGVWIAAGKREGDIAGDAGLASGSAAAGFMGRSSTVRCTCNPVAHVLYSCLDCIIPGRVNAPDSPDLFFFPE